MVTSYFGALSRFSRDVRLFLLSSALIGFCSFGMRAVLFNLFLLRLGYGPAFIGLFHAVATLTYALFALPSGALGRRWRSDRVLATGLTLVVAGIGLPTLTEFVPIGARTGWLLALAPLLSLGRALYGVGSGPFLTGATSPSERNHAFSIRQALWLLFAFAGSLAAGFLPGFFSEVLGISLDDPAPYRYALLVATLLLVPAVPALAATREPGSSAAREPSRPASPAPLAVIFFMSLVMLFRMGGEGTVESFLNVYLDAGLRMPTSQIGLLVGVSQLLGLLAALVAPLAMARWGQFRGFVWTVLFMAAGLLLLALIPHWGAVTISVSIYSVMGTISYTIVSVYQMEIVSRSWRAAMAAGTTMAYGFGVAAISLGGGRMIAALGYPSIFLMGAGITAIGALLFWAYFRVPRGEFGLTSRER
jgi:MFS family permease